MDLNQSLQFTSSPFPLRHMNFMHLSPPPTILPNNQQLPNEVGGDDMKYHLMQLQRQNLQLFWHQQMLDIQQISEIKRHPLPLARIKRIIKSTNKDVKMVSADVPVLFSKACEIFILELTLRSWFHTEESKRRTLQKSDIANAIRDEKVLDFLVDIVPEEEYQKQENGINMGGTESLPSNGELFPMLDMNQYHHDLNGEFLVRQEEMSQTFMVQPSMHSTQLIYEPGPQNGGTYIAESFSEVGKFFDDQKDGKV